MRFLPTKSAKWKHRKSAESTNCAELDLWRISYLDGSFLHAEPPIASSTCRPREELFTEGRHVGNRTVSSPRAFILVRKTMSGAQRLIPPTDRTS